MTDPLGLIIEDDADLAAIFAEALHLANLETEIIVNGAVAAARLKESRAQSGGAGLAFAAGVW